MKIASLGEANLNGVVFKEVYPEGILVSESARSQWENVDFGKNLAGRGLDLAYFATP